MNTEVPFSLFSFICTFMIFLHFSYSILFSIQGCHLPHARRPPAVQTPSAKSRTVSVPVPVYPSTSVTRTKGVDQSVQSVQIALRT